VEINVIGIAGVARVGKDTFCDCLKIILKTEGIEYQRFAFADELKEDINSFLLAKTGLNAYTTSDEEKISLRPILVEYGRLMRRLTGGKYWIDRVKEKIRKNKKNNTICVISDVRYANEAKWINSLSGGITLHLDRKGIKAANIEEEENDPLTKEACIYSIQWNSEEFTDLPTTQALEHLHATRLYKNLTRPRFNQEYSGSKSKRSLSERISTET